MPVRIRRRRLPVLALHRKFTASSVTRGKPGDDAVQEGLLCEHPSLPSPGDFSLLSVDSHMAEGGVTYKMEPWPCFGDVSCGYSHSGLPLIGLFPRFPPSEIVYALAGPSFLKFYFGVWDGEFVIPGWDYFCGDDYAAEGKQDTFGEEQEHAGPGKFGKSEDISKEEYMGLLDLLPNKTPYVNDLLRLDNEQYVMLSERHAIYRIKACKLLQGQSIDSLDDGKLQWMYPPELLKQKGYFRCYEENGTFGWFFHPDHCKLAALDDYQRLVLVDDGCYEYKDWNSYSRSYHTHEIDREYVKYCETISKELKWLEDYLALDSTCCEEWDKLSNKAVRQSMKIATRFTKISVGLVHLAFQEYKCRIYFNFRYLKEMDGVYFEIWKRVIKQQMSFKQAFKEICELDKFSMRQGFMKYVLNNGCDAWETSFDTCTAAIHEQVDETKAHWLIKETLRAMFKRSKGYEEYARKKLKIAELIGLIPTVIFRGTYWARFWSLRQKEEDRPMLKTACSLIETAAMEIFMNNGWRFPNRITF